MKNAYVIMNKIVEKALEQEKVLGGNNHKTTIAHKLSIGATTFWRYINGFNVSETTESKIIIGCNILLENPETKKVSQSMRANWYLKNRK